MTNNRIILVLLLAFSTGATAQMRTGGAHASLVLGPGIRGRYPGQGRTIWFGDPFFYDDYPSGSLASVPQSPQIVVLQSASPDPPTPKLEPLLIELRGDQYVRVGDSSQNANSPPHEAGSLTATANGPLAPAVLIYRDGHSEQVPDYAIIGAVIYARGNYWQNGYWSKPIQISSLNIPATIQANRNHGVNFVLPSGPNEVVTRP